MMRRGAALLVVLLLAAPGDAAVLCRAGSGKLALREACRKAEQVVNPAEIDVSSLTGPVGDAGVPGGRGGHPIAVVDSAGVEVGTVVEIDGSALTAYVSITHPALTEPVVFLASQIGFVPNRGGAASNVFYTSTNCASVPHVKPLSSRLRFAQVYGDSLYYQTGAVLSQFVQSVESDTGAPCPVGSTATPRGTCCFNSSSTQSAAPAVRVPLASLGFVPPFSARAR